MKWDWRQWSSHKQRVATGLALAVPVALILGFAPMWAWTLLVTALSLIALWEMEGLLFDTPPPVMERAIFFSAGILMPMGTGFLGTQGLLFSLALALFCGFARLLFSPTQDARGIRRLSLFCLSWLYVPFLMSHALLLGQMKEGRAWIFFILLVIFACDAGAYYTGKRFGRHKLYERVSPKKTMEGAMGGLLLGLAMGTGLALPILENATLWKVMLLSGILGAVSQMGDLMESMIKRISGKKDSSTILPGHGGLLDRLDSLVFTFPITCFFHPWM